MKGYFYGNERCIWKYYLKFIHLPRVTQFALIATSSRYGCLQSLTLTACLVCPVCYKVRSDHKEFIAATPPALGGYLWLPCSPPDQKLEPVLDSNPGQSMLSLYWLLVLFKHTRLLLRQFSGWVKKTQSPSPPLQLRANPCEEYAVYFVCLNKCNNQHKTPIL